MQGNQGDTLQSILNGKPLAMDRVLDIGCQVADALEAKHRGGRVHGDVRPANIRIANGTQVTLLDPGSPVANYRSPEQVRGEAPDPCMDVFSLGVVLYELLADRRPYQFETYSPFEIEHAICDTECPAPSEVTSMR